MSTKTQTVTVYEACVIINESLIAEILDCPKEHQKRLFDLAGLIKQKIIERGEQNE